MIAVPENIKKRGQKDAGIADINMVSSMNSDAVEYVLLAIGIEIFKGKVEHEEERKS